MVLLDTCVLIWLTGDPARLSTAALSALRSPAMTLHISAVSALEVGIGYRKGRVSLPTEPEPWFGEVIRTVGISVVDVSWQIAARSSALPAIHSDPFDRLIVATALAGGFSLVTPDPEIRSYPGVTVIW